MVTITDKAAEEFKNILKQENKEGHGIRIIMAGFGCHGPSYGLAFDKEPREGDEVLKLNGVKIFLDKNVNEALDGSTIDYITTAQGSGFTINNPNAATGCSSCGPGGCY